MARKRKLLGLDIPPDGISGGELQRRIEEDRKNKPPLCEARKLRKKAAYIEFLHDGDRPAEVARKCPYVEWVDGKVVLVCTPGRGEGRGGEYAIGVPNDPFALLDVLRHLSLKVFADDGAFYRIAICRVAKAYGWKVGPCLECGDKE